MTSFQFLKKNIIVDEFVRLSILGFFIHFSNCSYVPFEDCGSAYHLENIEVAGCQFYPCRFAIGSTVKITTHLTIQGTNFNPDDLVQRVYFVVSRIMVEVQVFPDPCTSARASNKSTCNLSIGERVAYEASLTVQDMPPLPATLFWTISNAATMEQVVCYRMTILFTNH